MRHNVPGQDSIRCVQPSRAIVWRAENGSLLKIDDSENDRGQRGEGKNGCAQPNSQTVIDWRAHKVPRLHFNYYTLMQIYFQNI